MSEEINWNEAYTAADVKRPQPKQSYQPKVDEELSKLAGTKVLTNDPRVIKEIANIRREEGFKEEGQDNFLKNPKHRKRIVKAINPNYHG